ncbi:MAG: metallophosphoesterase [Candidatus Diapherotrites archaeon]|nr:metallophosphoesterase [Candidatus Diapherotrites archaeon]
MNSKKILPNAEILDLALWLPKLKLLAIADLHLGMEFEFQKKGVLLPNFNFKETIERTNAIFAEIERKRKQRLETIVICGDLKHEFGTINEQEWKEVLEFLRLLQKHCKRVVLLKGNHDNVLGPLAFWESLEVQESFFIKRERMLFLHGDKIPKKENAEFKKAKIVIIGHEHPAITIREGAKAEKFKCFLKGKFGKKALIVLPSFNSFSEGSDVLNEIPLSPFLETNLENFEAWAVEKGKSYYFGKLKNLY